MFQDSVPAGSYNDPFLSSVCVWCMCEWSVWVCVCVRVCVCEWWCVCVCVCVWCMYEWCMCEVCVSECMCVWCMCEWCVCVSVMSVREDRMWVSVCVCDVCVSDVCVWVWWVWGRTGGRREDGGRSGYSTRTKKPTRQCGEQEQPSYVQHL